jgi:hypothetical protein
MHVDAANRLTLPYRWAGVEGTVAVEVAVNEDPAILGCADFARGFPYMRATIDFPAVGYSSAMGWIQLTSWGEPGVEAFSIDPYAPLREVPHPFGFFGFAPQMFDAPHTDESGDRDFVAHTFLGAIGGDLLDFAYPEKAPEARAILGFSWGFRKRAEGISHWGPRTLGPEAWDAQRSQLAAEHPRWHFAPGFHEAAKDE